jgi:hypothetical protein
MRQNNTRKPETIRSTINAVRRRNGIIKMALLMVPIGLLVFWFATRRLEYADYLIILIIAYLAVSSLIDRSDVCPLCRHIISGLPDEGHFLMPRISCQVHVCPFCGADFDSRILLPGNASPSESSLVNTGGQTQSNDGNNKASQVIPPNAR